MFVYTLKLDTNNYHHNRLARRFKMAQDIYRKSILEILKRESKQKFLRQVNTYLRNVLVKRLAIMHQPTSFNN